MIPAVSYPVDALPAPGVGFVSSRFLGGSFPLPGVQHHWEQLHQCLLHVSLGSLKKRVQREKDWKRSGEMPRTLQHIQTHTEHTHIEYDSSEF